MVRCRAATSVKWASTSATPTRYAPAGSSSSAVKMSSSRSASPRRNGNRERPLIAARLFRSTARFHTQRQLVRGR